MHIEILDTAADVGTAAAIAGAGRLRSALAHGRNATIVVATGASQFDMLDALVHADDIAWARVTAFHLDEYIGLPGDHPASFRRYLKERVHSQLPTLGAFHYLSGDTGDAHAEAARVGALIRACPIDVAFIGIGENGHLAFNDPPADFETQALVHIVTLDQACRQQQVGEGHFPTVADVPAQALSMTIPAILSAQTISCVVPNQRKAAAVRCALEGPISPDCPASILRRHPNCSNKPKARSMS